MAQVINGVPLNPAEGMDKVTWTDKITAGYFTGDVGKITAGELHSASIADTNEAYYYGIAYLNTTGSVQFDVAYADNNGYGSDTDSGAITGKTKAIYKQWANILLPPTEVTGGFFISRNNGLSSAPSSAAVSSGPDTNIYVLVGKRALFKDRLNKKNWTIQLTGSMSTMGVKNPTGSQILHLTDDSATVDATSTIAGPRYNVVSGSQGSIATSHGASVRTFGFFYPDQGVIVLSATELSASIPGELVSSSAPAVYHSATHADHLGAFDGFGTTTNVDQDYNNGLRFINCLRTTGGQMQYRSEEDQTSVSYFCRARAGQMNFSNSPTFRSGSFNELRNKTMRGNPTVYITGVELYDGMGNMVANGKLSTPLKKNFSSEATIKTKLTF
tara:strand:+ start:687 stop:1844 length:1158 start_codon:yes stop_codon:yes gene_type:complete